MLRLSRRQWHASTLSGLAGVLAISSASALELADTAKPKDELDFVLKALPKDNPGGVWGMQIVLTNPGDEALEVKGIRLFRGNLHGQSDIAFTLTGADPKQSLQLEFRGAVTQPRTDPLLIGSKLRREFQTGMHPNFGPLDLSNWSWSADGKDWKPLAELPGGTYRIRCEVSFGAGKLKSNEIEVRTK